MEINTETTIHKSTCRKCRKPFEFMRGEAKLECDPDLGKYLTLACPFCSSVIYVGVKD